jgi:hypothetical protein
MAFQQSSAPGQRQKFRLHPAIDVLYSRASWVTIWLNAKWKSREWSLLLFFCNHPVAERIYSSSIAVRLFHAAINAKKEIDSS